MQSPRLYNDLAHLWPLISPVADYAKETQSIWRFLQSRRPGAARLQLLELGAGGGHALSHLTDWCDCTAVDLSQAMLDQCRRLNPNVGTHAGDMRSIRLGRCFDAVLIHDAVDYMTTAQDVRATLATAAAHLNVGGVLLVAPTYTCETFVNHQCEHDQRGGDGLMLTYLSYVHDPDPADTTFEMVLAFVINEAGQVRVIEDRHTCGLFGRNAWLTMVDDGGFDTDVVEDDLPWTMFVGVKRKEDHRQ